MFLLPFSGARLRLLEEDEQLLQAPRSMNHQNAIIVRKGEKDILRAAAAEASRLIEELKPKKRKREKEEGGTKAKKAVK